MKYNDISIFKTHNLTEAKTPAPRGRTDTVPKAEGPEKKKGEYITKDIIVPAEHFLRAVLEHDENIYPLLLSLRYPSGGVNWKIENHRELAGMSRIPNLQKSNLSYFRVFEQALYMEFMKNGRFTVNKKYLPRLFHQSVLCRQDAVQLWKLLARTCGNTHSCHMCASHGGISASNSGYAALWAPPAGDQSFAVCDGRPTIGKV
ncbi:MAG: hypothetical protein LIP16_12590 [Clostridium sp.]|nr:hypothetical protein [Clostridium sp.]